MRNIKTKLITITLVSLMGFLIIFTPPLLNQANAQNNLIVEFEQTPLFNEVNFAPGDGVSRWIKVTNNSGQTQRIATEAINYPGFPNPDNMPIDDLSRVLLIIIRENGGNDLYGGSSPTGEKTLFNFYEDGETYLNSDISTGGTKTYEFEIIFPAEKENEWQGKTTTFDILIGFQGTGGLVSPGGGTGLPPGLTIQDESIITTGISETSVTITWLTTYMSTSQVIYAAEGEPHTLDLTDNTGTPPKYGYAHTTPEYDISSRVTVHSVTISGLTPGTTYYYRAVSHAALSPSSVYSGYFSDTETSTGNTFYAGTLDFFLASPADFSPEVSPTQSSSRTINVINGGSLGFKYTVQTANATGSLCNYLNLATDLDGNNKYTGPLTSFNYNVGEFSVPEDWIFAVSLTSNDAGLQNRTCTFDFIYSGTQIGSAGFSDTETFLNTVTAGIWEAPENQPHIDNISPPSGAPGIEVTIKGLNFKAYFYSWVNFGGKQVSAERWSDNEVIVRVPPGKGVVDVMVVSDMVESNRVKFTYNEPFIDWIDPSFGHPSEQVTISGRDFGYKDLQPTFWVRFGCSLAPKALPWTDTEIMAKAPLDYGTGEIDRTILKWLIILAAREAGVDIPGPILDKIIDLLSSCEIEVPPSEGKIEVGVRVHTPAGTSNAAVFTYRVSTIIEAYLYSPGELRVYDSLGRVTGLMNGEVKEEIPYSLCDGSSAIIVSPHDSYRYEVVGTDEDTYGLGVNFVENGGVTNFTATNIPTVAGMTHQYTIDWDALSQGEKGVTLQIDENGDGIFEKTVIADNDLTYDEFILQTETVIDFDPDTLNLKSQGKFVTAYIELPEGYEVSQIDIPSIILNGSVPALVKLTQIGDYDKDGTPDLMVKFDRSKVQTILSLGSEVPVTITGKVFHNGNYIDFKGSDVIRVIEKGAVNKNRE